MSTSRRDVIVGAGFLAAVASAPALAAPGAAAPEAAWFQAVLERFAGFGVKAAGGPGDMASGAWLEGDLEPLGYRCERQAFDVPYAEARTASLAVGDRRAAVFPQAIVKTTGPDGLKAPLRLSSAPGGLDGAIALIVLPSRRWVSMAEAPVSAALTDAFGRGAAAAVLVTTGPTGEAIALNVSATKPGFQRPVAILAPKDAAAFVAAAGSRDATLTVDADSGRRSAFNLIARLDRGAAKTLIITTPRSGWFTCAAERGAGVAIWLSLAHWLAAAKPKVNVELIATSGHEYIYLGGEEYLKHHAPKPADTHMWVHIGASAAARDWHEVGWGLQPLPTPDGQRVLTATPQVIEAARRAFKGISGLEAVYPADRVHAGGELVNVIEAGYTPAIGLYGGHRFFHTPGDDMRCVSGDLVRPVAMAFRAVVAAALS
jgi:hypothetical protein